MSFTAATRRTSSSSGSAADLHLQHGVAGVEMTAHLVLQVLHGLAGEVPAAADVAEHLWWRPCRCCSARPRGDAAACRRSWRPHPRPRPRWCRCRPSVRCDRRIFPAASWRRGFCPARDCSPVSSSRVCRIGRQNARDEARPHLRAAGIAAGGIERKARDRLAVADDVGHHRHHRCGHLGEVEARIADVRIERHRAFANIDNTHPDLSRLASAVPARRSGTAKSLAIASPRRIVTMNSADPCYTVVGGRANRGLRANRELRRGRWPIALSFPPI